MARTGFRTCRYINCKHESRQINLADKNFVAVGKSFFHADCYEEKIANEKVINQKNTKILNDMECIKNTWIQYISRTVSISALRKVLNEMIKDRGIDSDYIVFTVQYCVQHKRKLNYPAGLWYFVDDQEIKDAYEKKQLSKNRVDASAFVVTEPEDYLKFNVDNKKTGFSQILRG